MPQRRRNGDKMISKRMLDRWIEEDVPWFDLTTEVLGIGGQVGSIRWYSREEAVAACVDEGAELARGCGLTVIGQVARGERILLTHTHNI